MEENVNEKLTDFIIKCTYVIDNINNLALQRMNLAIGYYFRLVSKSQLSSSSSGPLTPLIPAGTPPCILLMRNIPGIYLLLPGELSQLVSQGEYGIRVKTFVLKARTVLALIWAVPKFVSVILKVCFKVSPNPSFCNCKSNFFKE